MPARIPTSSPILGDLESRYVLDALAKGEISGLSGSCVSGFEEAFAGFCGVPEGVATTSGTSALHLAVRTVGLGPGDEVLVATLTNMATFFSVIQCGATPIPVDVEADTGNLDPSLLHEKLTPKTVGVLVVHLFGHPADMHPIQEFCAAHGLWLIEDAAEAHGATYRGQRVGSFGEAGCFSFYANKIITTGEGGMITFKDAALAADARNKRNLAFGEDRRFMHTGVGYNYRMTNLQGALGMAQMSRIEDNIAGKQDIAAKYDAGLADLPNVSLPPQRKDCESVYWMYHVVLTGEWENRRDECRDLLSAQGIDTRESFVPFDQQEFFIGRGAVEANQCPVAARIGANGFYLPSGPHLPGQDQGRVIAALRMILE